MPTLSTDVQEVTKQLNTLADSARNAAVQQQQKMEIEDVINGTPVRCTVTPQSNPNKNPYTLFYVGGMRKPKSVVVRMLVSA